MLILAIDPGRTSGICVVRTTEGKKGFVVVTALEMPWESRMEFLETLLDGTYFDQKVPQLPEAVVIESFRLRQGRALEQAGSDFPSSQVIGSIQAFLWMDKPTTGVLAGSNGQLTHHFEIGGPARPVGLARLHFQEPSTMSHVAIEPEDMPLLAGSPHKQDAYKHARFYYLAHIREWRKP